MLLIECMKVAADVVTKLPPCREGWGGSDSKRNDLSVTCVADGW